MRSDDLYWEGTVTSLRAAVRLEPRCWLCYMRLAQLDDAHAEDLLRTSLQLNQYNSDAAIDLGLRYEADGDYQGAEKLLLHAFAVDRTYAPRWSLANFYFRRGDTPSFWKWARLAAEMPDNDISALFDLCWRVSSDPATIDANIIEDNPSVLRQYVDFLDDKGDMSAAVHPALRLVEVGSADTDHARLFDLTDRLIASDDSSAAASLRDELIRRHWIVADSSIPNNAEFARDPLPIGFDWTLQEATGLHSWPGSSGLVTEFTGDEPDTWIIAEQALLLQPGKYRLDSSYHTRGIPANTGIRWEIADMHSDTPIASTPFLSSETKTTITMPFTLDSQTHLVRLRLVYRRQLGTPRVSGTLVIPSIRIQPTPST
jgi:tetratricopeptide (TPR) repeat protein